jgi:CubicO group peptidase (beta-lactamase class C family)
VGIILHLGALLLGLSVARADVPPPNARLEAAIDEVVAKQGVSADGPGVAVMVRQPGKLLFQKGYGRANLRNGAPITPQTRFYLASLSKSFTATAVLLLHERGRLSIDDNVRLYVPELPVWGRGQVIRIKDLLHHVSGLPEYLDLQNVPGHHRGYWVGEDYLLEIARRRLPLHFATGYKYEYNNTNYVLLAEIVQRVAKKPFGAFLHDEVFVPAGMTSAFLFEVVNGTVPRATFEGVNAIGYERGKAGEPVWKESWGTLPFRRESLVPMGDGGIWGNLEDLARWDAAMRDGKILKPATRKLALAPSQTADGKTNNYGFGWSLYFGKGGSLIGYGHRGLWRGFRANYYDYVLEDRTTVILSNRSDFDPDKFWYALDDAVEKNQVGK